MTNNKLKIAASLATKNVVNPLVISIAREYNDQHIWQGSWQSYGSGEIGCEVFYDDPVTEKPILLGELSGDNGCNTFYNPSGKAWTQTLDDKSDEWHLRTFAEIFNTSNSPDALVAEEKRKQRRNNHFLTSMYKNKYLRIYQEKRGIKEKRGIISKRRLIGLR